MVTYLLPAKLHPPPARRELIPRSRLVERLDVGLLGADGFSRKLTLFSASAGSGKTTLAAEWLRAKGVDSAWLSLDQTDDDPRRFLAYLVAAMQQADLNLGQAIQQALESPQVPPTNDLLSWLLKDIADRGRLMILVLDDYHTVQVTAIHDQVNFILEYQPPNLHLVVITRQDPPLPIARLRARGQLLEVREESLCFSVEECDAFLRGNMGIGLSAQAIVDLRQRTEGWATGIQLAAVAMQGLSDLEEFVQSFTGSNRFILDFLMDEVLERQAPSTQEFLFKTSILDRLSAPLCDHITGRRDSADQLKALEAANLFIIPLDQTRSWYRYHHLFAELLRYRLHLLPVIPEVALHQAASRWYEGNGFLEEAIRHSLAVEDWLEAGRQICIHSAVLLRRGEVITLLNWCQRVPSETQQENPEFCLTYAWALILKGDYDRAAGLLAQAESLVAESSELLGQIYVAQANLAQARSDESQLVEYSERALALLPPDDLANRGLVAVNLGLSYWHMGRMLAADQAFQEAQRAALHSGNDYARVTAEIFLARSLAVRGSLRLAERSLLEISRTTTRYPILCLVHLDLACLYYEWNDLGRASDYVERGLQIARQSRHAEFEVAAYLLLARLCQARRQSGQVAEAIQSARRIFADGRLPPRTADRIFALQVELGISDLGQALLPNLPEGDVSAHPFYRFLGLTQARLLLADGRRVEASEKLASAAQIAGKNDWDYGLIAARVLQTLAAPTPDAALRFLGETLHLAEPEGYLRTFADAGEALTPLLQEAARRGIVPGYVGKILSGIGEKPKTTQTDQSSLIEPLSERELEVLRLVMAGLSNREIAAKLFISPGTAKTHIHNLCGKLGVRNRTEAAMQAKDLNLV